MKQDPANAELDRLPNEVLAEDSRLDGGLKTEHSVRRTPCGTLLKCTASTVTQPMAADELEAANRRARAHTADMAAGRKSRSPRAASAPSRLRGRARAPRAASPRRRGSRRSTSGGGDPGDPDGDSDPDADESDPQGIGGMAGLRDPERDCQICGQPCKRVERTCARCRKRRQRLRNEVRKLEAEPRQIEKISAGEAARIGKRDSEIELLERLMRAAPGGPRPVRASGTVIG
jgi:hypothetical protein